MEHVDEGVLRTFVIADVRGYTRFTQTRGDEAAAELAARFARLTRDAVTAGGGELVELRGDEALVVFASPRQAVRTAVEIQRRLRGALDPDEALPLGIGIGIDTGEAVPVEGGWRGKALNVAARLCSLSQPGEIKITETVGALAGGIPGVRLVPRKPVRVKGIDQPVRLLDVVPETPLPPLRPLDDVSTSRRRVLVPAAVGALVVVAGVVAALVFGGSSSAGRLATNSLGAVDAAGHVHDVVAVGKGPSDVVADDKGALWVADEPGHALLRVDPQTHAVTQSFSLGDAQPTALAFGDGALWVLDGAGRRLLRWAPDPGRTVGRYGVGNGAADVAFGAGAAWVPNQIDGTVTRVGVGGTDGKAETIGVGIEPAAVAFGAGALWVANAGGDNVARIDVARRTVVQAIPVGRNPQAVAVHGSSVWVTSAADKTVWEIDATTNAARRTIPLPDEPNALAADSGGVWAASYRAGTVTRIEGDRPSTHSVGGGPTALTAAGDRVWVAAGAPDESHRGGTLRIAGDFPVTDQQFGSPGATVNPMLGDGLVGLKQVGGPSGTTLVPDLATAIPAPSNGGKTYTFHLREGIRYSDGSPVKPRDFVFTLKRLFRLQDPGVIGQFYGSLAGADACLQTAPASCDVTRMVTADDGAMTVTFHLAQPDPAFVESLAFPLAWVLPPGTPMRQLTTTLVPSTGPYKLAEVVPRKRMILTRNPYFHEWSHDAQPAGYPDRIVVTPVADQTAEVQADRADATAAPISAAQVSVLATRYPARLHSVLYSKLLYVFLNTKLRPFDDVRVRRAVALAIDRRAVVNRIGGPVLNQVTCQVLPPNLLGFRPYCPWTSRPAAGVWTAPDLARAKRLVAASATRGMRVTVWQPVDEPWRAAARELEATLRRLGYRVDKHVVGSDIFNYFARVGDPKARAQAGPASWGPDLPIPSQMVSPLLACASPPALRLSGYCDHAVDRKAQRAEEHEATSPDSAAGQWAAVDRAFTDAAPIIPIAVLGYAHLVSDRVGNFQAHPQWGPIYDQMWVH